MKDNEIFENENLSIKVNNRYTGYNFINHVEDNKKNIENFIYISTNNNGISLTLDDMNFVINSFQEIINYIEECTKFKKDDKVKIIKGKFAGFEGRIIDMDECDNKRPLAVKIFSEELNGTVYINYDEVEKIN